MTTRTSSAHWNGDLKAGSGELSLGSGRFTGPYTFVSRFETGEGGTNPEELIGAAHAACYSMAFSGALAKAGHTPDEVRTEATVHLDQVDGKQTITKVALVTVGKVPGIEESRFLEMAEESKAGCPVSRLLSPGAEITLEATLEG